MLPRNAQHLVFVADLGPVDRPVRDWDGLAAALGPDAGNVRRYINQGAVELLLLRYERGGAYGMLAIATAPGRDGGPPTLRPAEAADTSQRSRTLRAGPQAKRLGDVRVAIVGCGAVGSYVADLLCREGVRRFHLVDPDTYRPGNVIRHAAPRHLVGHLKVDAVAETLRSLGLGTPTIDRDETRLSTPDDALHLVHEFHLVLDASADERATALLRWAAESTGRPVVAVCVQRDGGIARADRVPLRGDEDHLPVVPVPTQSASPIRERGCGDSVSPTPPSAVVAAAELAVELARDELTLECSLPASVLRVLQSQPDEPYTTVTTMTSRRRGATTDTP